MQPLLSSDTGKERRCDRNDTRKYNMCLSLSLTDNVCAYVISFTISALLPQLHFPHIQKSPSDTSSLLYPAYSIKLKGKESNTAFVQL